jgi:hypothetical protein
MFERSATTRQVCDALRSTNGDVSYARLCEVTGRGLDQLRPTIAAARRYLERDEGIVFATVRGEGLRRLTDPEKVESAKGFTRKIHRTAGRGITRIGTVSDFTALSNEDQMTATITQTVLQAVQRETRPPKGETS